MRKVRCNGKGGTLADYKSIAVIRSDIYRCFTMATEEVFLETFSGCAKRVYFYNACVMKV